MCDLSNKIKQINALKNGNGLQYLLNEGCKILGNPLYVHDVDLKLIAHTENVYTDDCLWNELITTGVHSKKSLEFFKNEDFIDAVANASTITFLLSDKLRYDRILGKIQNKSNITVACVDVVDCNKPFEKVDAQIFEALCGVIAKEINRSDFYQIYGEQHQENVICDLLNGDISDKRLYTRRVASIYEGLKNNIYVAAVDISKYNLGYAYSIFFKELLKKMECSFKYAVYTDYITFIFSSENTSANIKKDLSRLMRVFERNNMHVGISSCFEDLFVVNKHFTEAVHALNSGLNQKAKQRVYLYDEIR